MNPKTRKKRVRLEQAVLAAARAFIPDSGIDCGDEVVDCVYQLVEHEKKYGSAEDLIVPKTMLDLVQVATQIATDQPWTKTEVRSALKKVPRA